MQPYGYTVVGSPWQHAGDAVQPDGNDFLNPRACPHECPRTSTVTTRTTGMEWTTTMARNILIAQTNAADGRDEEFNDWYTNVHLLDALAVPGFVAAQRFRISTTQRPGSPPCRYRYLTVYEMEGDPQENLAALAKAVPGMQISDAMHFDRVFQVFESVTERIESPEA